MKWNIFIQTLKRPSEDPIMSAPEGEDDFFTSIVI
jgi:hypothetical protein